jgi:hypothetical protein
MKTAVFVLLAAAAVVLFLAPAAEAQPAAAARADASTLTMQVIMRTGPFWHSDQLCRSVGPVRDSSVYKQSCPRLSLFASAAVRQQSESGGCLATVAVRPVGRMLLWQLPST